MANRRKFTLIAVGLIAIAAFYFFLFRAIGYTFKSFATEASTDARLIAFALIVAAFVNGSLSAHGRDDKPSDGGK